MNVLSLFSGGGLGDYGLELAGMKIVGQVEINDYCKKILRLRWPNVPKWHDIKQVKGHEIVHQCGPIDLISGGFPCQPFSLAGKRRGAADDRNLWPEMFRVIREIKPAWVLAENVPGVLGFVESVLLPDLESARYETITLVFPAHALGAPHRRDRVWIVAHTNGKRNTKKLSRKEPVFEQGGQFMADSGGSSWWTVEPDVGRMVNVCPKRVDRLKMLGNGQVVHVVKWIGEKIMRWEAE